MARDDDDLPLKRVATAPMDLTPLSVDELRHYIAGLEAEIARARAAIDGKQGHRSGAESLFRK